MYQEIAIQQKFSDAFCNNSSQFTWVRGRDGDFQHITNYSANLIGFKSFEQVIGLTVYDIKTPGVMSAPEFDRQLKQVISTKQPLQAIDIHTYHNKQNVVFITTLNPVFGLDQHVNSIHGQCTTFTPQETDYLLKKLIPSQRSTKLISHNISQSLELIDRYTQWGLTVKQSECLYYIMRGRSNKEIGLILNLSPRTIDTYTDIIKDKTNCSLRRDIIDLSIAERLLRYLPYSLVKNSIVM